MRISKQFLKKLQESLQKQPLQHGEHRRIEGMGSHYASVSPTHEGRNHFFSVQIGEQLIYIYK